MAKARADVLMTGPAMPIVAEEAGKAFILHKLWEAPDKAALIAELGPRLRAIIASGGHMPVDSAFMSRFPNLEIVAGTGVGYDHIDAQWAGRHGIAVTNTPGVLTEEVADTALGLLLCTVRELPQSERYLRAGKWPGKNYPLTATLRDRKVGIVGFGRIGKAIARRLDAAQVPVVYHGRRKQTGARYRYFKNLGDMARHVDVLVVVTPGGAETENLIDAKVLGALGPDGILINVARGSVVDEQALIAALKAKTIRSAGLDVFLDEPHVPPELIAMDNVVLFPHVGSASVHTRRAMGQLVVDNLLSWARGKGPITPVAETPWRPKRPKSQSKAPPKAKVKKLLKKKVGRKLS
jgi:lactate dehydrogenase-like 2-hydroxyacid dehydrogenase